MKSVLAIDDEEDILEIIEVSLEDKYHVSTALSFKEAFEILEKNQIDIVLLDIGLPDVDGFEICSQIRSIDRHQGLPIIFISGQTENSKKTIGYKLGGDAYVEKPIDFPMLKAIIERLLTKNQNVSNSSSYSNIKIDHSNRNVLINEEVVKLNNKEFLILEYFIKKQDHIVTREQILSNVWKDKKEISDRVIDTHISNLRKKISNADCTIQSIYQEGYKLIKKAS